MSANDASALRRWEPIDRFLVCAAALFDRSVRNGQARSLSVAWLPACAIADVLAEMAQRRVKKSPEVSQASLWFLAMAYLEARKTPRYRYELDSNEEEYLQWMFPEHTIEDPDEVLAPRHLVGLYLFDRKGWAPDWFQPLPEA